MRITLDTTYDMIKCFQIENWEIGIEDELDYYTLGRNRVKMSSEVINFLQIQDWELLMDIDIDCILYILRKVKETRRFDARLTSESLGSEYPHKVIVYNIREMLRYLLIECDTIGYVQNTSYPNFIIHSLTPKGDALYQGLKNPKILKKVKEIMEKQACASIEYLYVIARLRVLLEIKQLLEEFPELDPSKEC